LSFLDFFTKKKKKLTVAEEGEEVVAQYIKTNLKYKILRRNYKTKIGEVDIIALDKKTKILHFVEVKVAADTDLDLVCRKVELTKIEKYKKIALTFVNSYCKYENYGINIDLAAVDKSTWRVAYFSNLTGN
jgi:putative endonuclease